MPIRRINNPGAAQQTKDQLAAGTLYNAYLKYSDVQANGVAGGAASAATWHTRTLNTEDADTDNIGSLSANRITLPAGTYFVNAICPARTGRKSTTLPQPRICSMAQMLTLRQRMVLLPMPWFLVNLP